jgi:hypothetical protein
MDKSSALSELNRRGSMRLDPKTAHFANINSSKPVWWLDLPILKVFDDSEPFIDLVLADSAADHLYHLRVPKDWLIENVESLVVREDKDVISLELSCMPSNLFQDVRPTCGKLSFARFRV